MLPRPSAPAQAKEVEEKNAVEGQPGHAELNQQGEISVVHVEGAEMIALHTAAKLGIHIAGRPTGQRPLLKHRPAGLVYSQARFDRTAFFGPIAKSRLQRMIAETDGQAKQETHRSQKSAHGQQSAFD